MPAVKGFARQGAAIGTRRDQVTSGQVFQLAKKDGTLGDKLYGCISQNGKFYSVNLSTGELASTRDGAKRVQVVGKFTIETQLVMNGQRRATTRGNVRDTEIFVVKGGTKVYANLGKTTENKFIALNLGNENHAVSTDARKNVVVMGTYTIHPTIVRA